MTLAMDGPAPASRVRNHIEAKGSVLVMRRGNRQRLQRS